MTGLSHQNTDSLRAFIRVIGSILIIIMILVGTILLYAGIQNYINEDSQGLAFGTTVLGLAIISFPLAVFLAVKAIGSYRKGRSEYEMPDTPMRFFMFTFFSAGFLLLSFVAILMYIIYAKA